MAFLIDCLFILLCIVCLCFWCLRYGCLLLVVVCFLFELLFAFTLMVSLVRLFVLGVCLLVMFCFLLG